MTGDEETALTDQCLTRYARELHNADTLQLAHEAERCECLPRSPLADQLRQLVDHERTSRQEAA